MRSSKSQSRIGESKQLDRSVSARYIYINQEPQKSKDISTIFHSPFKNGRKNASYNNPTFMSSNLFYPQNYIKQGETKVNLQYNHNQRTKKQLYEQRIKREDLLVGLMHENAAKQRRSRREFNMSRVSRKSNLDLSSAKSRSRIVNDENTLTRELEGLINYHENIRSVRKSQRKKDQECPIYIDKNKMKKEEEKYQRNQRQLREWVDLTNRIQEVKRNHKKNERKKESEALQATINRNRKENQDKYCQSRRNAAILANILKQQIAMYKQKQQHERRHRNQFY